VNKLLKTRLLILFIVVKSATSLAQAGMEINNNIDIYSPPGGNTYDFTRLKTYKTNNSDLYNKGFLDITKSPYNVGPNDGIDDTANIQNAIYDALNANLVCFFPSGTYNVSDQLRCIRQNSKDSRKFGVQLQGSTKGSKPVIRLADNSVFTTPNLSFNDKTLLFFDSILPKIDAAYKPILNPDGSFIYESDDTRHYGSQLRGFKIEMGNNPSKNAVSMSGAQYSTIEDIDISGDFYSGICDFPGSGGYTANITVDGGSYGIYQNSYRPNPTITGVTLTNQKAGAIWLALTRGPLVVTGFKIVSPNPAPGGYKAIQITGGSSATNTQRALCLTNGSIEIISSSFLTAIDNTISNSIAINNLYVKAAGIVKSGSSTLNGDGSKWLKMDTYTFTGTADAGTVYKDFSTQKTAPSAAYQYNSPLIDAASGPPADFVNKHTWNVSIMPSWEDADLLDISKAPYNATPENINTNDDDTDKIQLAINDAVSSGKTVFIPRGHFHIRKTLNFPSGLKIIGASKSISVIQPVTSPDFNPVIQTENNAGGSLIMSDFGILTIPYHTMLNIQTNNTILRDILTEIDAKSKNCYNLQWNCPYIKFTERPYYLFSGNAGGKIFGLSADQLVVPMGNPSSQQLLNFNLLKVTSNQPLEFHQLSIEHLDNSPQVQINGAENVSIFGFKYEGHHELLNVLNSNNVFVIGGSGNYSLTDLSNSRGLVYVDNASTNLSFQNLCRTKYGSTDVTNNWVIGEDATKKVTGGNSVNSFLLGVPSLSVNDAYNAISETSIKPYINPLTKELTIEDLLGNETIQIYSMLGNNVINTKNTDGTIARINITNLSTGVYIVKVNNQVTKFLKNF
jgi:hypothetical protein